MEPAPAKQSHKHASRNEIATKLNKKNGYSQMSQSQSKISFLNMDSSPAIEEHVRTRIAELEKYHPRIVGCDVVVAAAQGKQLTGREFEIRLTVRVPGPDIHVSGSYGRSSAAEDVSLAVHQVFDSARRELKEQTRKMSGHDGKQHPPILHGTIDRLFAGEGYGFIRGDDGEDIYVGRDSLVAGDWDKLQVGSKVRFREQDGDKGPYAANVAIMS